MPCNHNVKHAMVSDPEEASISLPVSSMLVLTSGSTTPSSFPSRHLRGSIPSTFWLTAYLLAVLRLKRCVTTAPPRTRYPVDGLPSGAGFSPARLHDLARPHSRIDPNETGSISLLNRRWEKLFKEENVSEIYLFIVRKEDVHKYGENVVKHVQPLKMYHVTKEDLQKKGWKLVFP